MTVASREIVFASGLRDADRARDASRSSWSTVNHWPRMWSVA